jgi:hypothetical protein
MADHAISRFADEHKITKQDMEIGANKVLEAVGLEVLEPYVEPAVDFVIDTAHEFLDFAKEQLGPFGFVADIIRKFLPARPDPVMDMLNKIDERLTKIEETLNKISDSVKRIFNIVS